jgi:transposase InsO family protein
MADNDIDCSMSRSGNVWDNAAMESFFSSLKTERIARKTYRTRDEATGKYLYEMKFDGYRIQVNRGGQVSVLHALGSRLVE